MKHTVSFNRALKIIEITFMGVIKIDDLYDILCKAAALSSENSCFLWIIDYRGALFDYNAFNMAHFIFAMRLAMENLEEKAQFVKRANVLQEPTDDPNFVLSLLKSNLHNKRIKQFTTYFDAFCWLYEDETPKKLPLSVNKTKQTITIQTCIKSDIKTVWTFWKSKDTIMQWFHETGKWKTSSVIHDLRENGIFSYRIESVEGKLGYTFSGKFKRVVAENLIEYVLDDGRFQKTIFYPYGNETIVTSTIEADGINIIEDQQKSWQNILENFRDFVEKESAKPKD